MRKRTHTKNDETDNRAIAIYTRKSRITNKGDSIGVQVKQSADYAINQLGLPEDYTFLEYSDKGLSGYYSDRPDFQRMLHDIEAGKIKAVACYKLDRISRKTSDLMRLLEYFERHDVVLLVCSNNINTQISTSKIIIQVLAIIAEFERDILTERIQDNLMELSKDGRWMGGTTPTGFTAERVSTGSGKNKSAISFLVPRPEEKKIVQKLFALLLKTRSYNSTATELNKEYTTKNGAAFTVLAVKDIAQNPIYCVADKDAYQYFLDNGANLFGDIEDFDGKHGISAYNKTDQMKIEDENSTFFNPKFTQSTERKPITAWIVSVGKHEGFISSADWISVQRLCAGIAERHNRPHRKTNALLSGLICCPRCGTPLRVTPESNRWTNGKPRFKYTCRGFRKKTCTFKAIDGVEMDEFVVQQLAAISQENHAYYKELFEAKLANLIQNEAAEQEYADTKKAIKKLNTDITAQIRNMREANEPIRKFIQSDIEVLSEELQKQEQILQRMESERGGDQRMTHEIMAVRKQILSFAEQAKKATPEELVTMIQLLVDRILVTYEDGKQICHIFIKGCTTEDYTDFFGAAGYIAQDAKRGIAVKMCDCDRDRERDPQLCRDSAPSGM